MIIPLFWYLSLYLSTRFSISLSLFSPLTPPFFTSLCLSHVFIPLPSLPPLFQLWKPHFLIAVPRLFETIHKGVVSNLRQQSQASAIKRKLISTLTACTQLYLRFYKTWANLLVRAQKPNLIERVS